MSDDGIRHQHLFRGTNPQSAIQILAADGIYKDIAGAGCSEGTQIHLVPSRRWVGMVIAPGGCCQQKPLTYITGSSWPGFFLSPRHKDSGPRGDPWREFGGLMLLGFGSQQARKAHQPSGRTILLKDIGHQHKQGTLASSMLPFQL